MGAAVVHRPRGPGPGIITERDILSSIGAEQDPDKELVADHLTRDVVFAAPDWSLEEAAAAMVRGGFRHLIVLAHVRPSPTHIYGVMAVRRLGDLLEPTAQRSGYLTGQENHGLRLPEHVDQVRSVRPAGICSIGSGVITLANRSPRISWAR